MNHSTDRTDTRQSILSCPKCGGKVEETWLTRTTKKDPLGFYELRKKPKLLTVLCTNCRFNLGSVKQPEGKLIQKINE